jgi:TonB-dependent SusC/RagA subfamily outer membrane receptor
MMKATLLSALIFLSVISIPAQTRVIHGNLTAFDTYPVKNIEITSKKAGATSISDSLGNFSIVCKEKDVILVRPVAFKPARKKVGPNTGTVRMNLQFIDSDENRKIAVGYGYINEKDLSFGVSHMENDQDKFCSYSNIYDLIRGQLSGVSVQGRNVYVRGGMNSINLSTTALFVVDGQTTNSIDWVQPCQVKSIDVLKDGNAAVYGARGGNGVILIELVN